MILEHGGVVQKLLIPALEHHILSISSLSRGIKFGSGENITKNKDDIFDQDETVVMEKYISVIEAEKFENYNLSLRGYDCVENFPPNDKDELGEKKLLELKSLNYNELSTNFDFNSIKFDFGYLQEKEHIGDQEYFSAKAEFKKGNNGLFKFENKRNFF
mgnify:CR=1 FL=1